MTYLYRVAYRSVKFKQQSIALHIRCPIVNFVCVKKTPGGLKFIVSVSVCNSPGYVRAVPCPNITGQVNNPRLLVESVMTSSGALTYKKFPNTQTMNKYYWSISPNDPGATTELDLKNGSSLYSDAIRTVQPLAIQTLIIIKA